MFWYSRHCVCSLLSFIQHQQHQQHQQQQHYNDLKWQQNMRFFLFSVSVDTRELKWKLRMEIILLVCSVFFFSEFCFGFTWWFVLTLSLIILSRFSEFEYIWWSVYQVFESRLYSFVCDKTAKLTKHENIAFCEATIHISRSINKHRYSIHFPVYLLPKSMVNSIRYVPNKFSN